MGEIRITRRDGAKTFSKPTGSLHVFKLSPLHAYLLEMEDLHFHHDSAVLLPDYDAKPGETLPPGKTTGLTVLRTCYRHAEANPAQKILVCGHTDTSGDAGTNVTLSEMRADNVFHVLTGDRKKWVDGCKKKEKVEDHQQILKWAVRTFGWDTDPGPINNTKSEQTKKATKEFQKRYNLEFGAKIGEDGDVGTETWGAFFDVYMLDLMDLLETDKAGLEALRKKLQFVDGKLVGCGENWPIEEKNLNNYRSPTNRRVEILFFEENAVPLLQCHPAPGKVDPKGCMLYSSGTYVFKPIPVPPPKAPVEAAVQFVEIAGLYKPGYSDPKDVTQGTTRRSGFKPGYKSEDDLGRIFINAVPRTDPSVDWDSISKKNRQFIELTVEVKPPAVKLPASARIVWEWEDPDDPSNEGGDVRDDAGAIFDPNDYIGGAKTGSNPDDNAGKRDFPSADAGAAPQFEEIAPYTMSPLPGAKQIQTTLVGNKSRVRFHVTNVGGDNFRMKVHLKDSPKVKATGGDQTGLMTMWKRVDVEYRKMEGALDIPVDKVPPYFEKAFVQMDFTAPLPTPKKAFLSLKDDDVDKDSETYVKKPPTGVFEHESKPGWFLLVAAHEAAQDVGTAVSDLLYEGPATVIDVDYPTLGKGEVLLLPVALPQPADSAILYEGTNSVLFSVWRSDANVPAAGQTVLHLRGLDFQSEFKPGVGGKTGLIGDPGEGGAYDRSDRYFPRFKKSLPANTWVAGGLGFGENVNVRVISAGGVFTSGISPTNVHTGKEYFAGRTIIFTMAPSTFTPARGSVRLGGTWAAGDTVTVKVDGTAVAHTAVAGDTPATIAAALVLAVNAHATVKTKVVASRRASDVVRLAAVARGPAGNAITLAVSRSSAAGTASASAATLTGGGADSDDLLDTVIHEFTHAFGFPHKCGYYTFEKPAAKKCSMNYFNTWLYTVGTRTLQRFVTGDPGRHLCGLHLDGVRKVHMEDNPALWTF